MLWLIVAIISATLYSLGSFFDNYITDVIFHGNKPESVKGVYAPMYILGGIALLIIFGFHDVSLQAVGLIALGSIFSSVASIFYYRGLKHEDATGAAIYCQISPILYLLVDVLFIGLQLTGMHLLGFFVILVAPFVVILSQKRAKSRKLELGSAINFIIYTILATIGGTFFAFCESRGNNLMTLFAFSQVVRGLSEFTLFYSHKSWRNRVKNICKTNRAKLITVTLINQLVFVIAELLYRYTYTLVDSSTSAVVVNAGVLIITFFLGIILSIIWPMFGREKIRRREILVHLIAIILVTAGIIIIG